MWEFSKFRHLPEYSTNENVEIVAVCDIVEDRVNETAERYNAKAYKNFEDLLADETIDAVSVCLPNYLHEPVSIAASNAGKHVLCEKPMATSYEEENQMIAAARKQNKKLMIGHNQRFVPSQEKARQLIASGELGKFIVSVLHLVIQDQKVGVSMDVPADFLIKMKRLLGRWVI